MITSNKDEACYLFGDVVDQMFDPLINLTNTFRYVSRAIDIAGNQIAIEEADRYLTLASNPQFTHIFGHTYQELADGTYRAGVAGIVNNDLDLAKRRTAASALVFAHAVFESSVQDCLMIAYHAAPDDWLGEIREKKLTIDQSISPSLANTCAALIRDYINGLDRQSVLKKLEVFHRVTKPPTGHIQPVGYQYDPKKIEALDEARHKAAHRDPTSYAPATLDADVEYLRVTILYLLSILISKYDVRNKPRPKSG